MAESKEPPVTDLGVPPIDTTQPPVTKEEDEHVARVIAWNEAGQILEDPFSGIDPGIRAYVDDRIAKVRADFDRAIESLLSAMTAPK